MSENTYSVNVAGRLRYTGAWTWPQKDAYQQSFYAYKFAREAMVGLDRLKQELVGEGKLTEAGINEALKAAASEKLQGAARYRAKTSAMRAHLREKAEELSAVKQREADDLVGFMQDQELRSYFRSATGDERQALIQEMLSGQEPDLTAAIVRSPRCLSGLSGEVYGQLKDRSIPLENMQRMDELAQQADAINAAEKALDALFETAPEIVGGTIPEATAEAVRQRLERKGERNGQQDEVPVEDVPPLDAEGKPRVSAA